MNIVDTIDIWMKCRSICANVQYISVNFNLDAVNNAYRFIWCIDLMREISHINAKWNTWNKPIHKCWTIEMKNWIRKLHRNIHTRSRCHFNNLIHSISIQFLHKLIDCCFAFTRSMNFINMNSRLENCIENWNGN